MSARSVTIALAFAFPLALELASFARLAHAEDTFEQKANPATTVKNLEDVVWALTAACDKGDDTQMRQCRQLRDAKAKAVLAGPMLVEADAEAFEVGAYSPQKKSVGLVLTGCIRCGGVTVDGKTWHLTSAAPRVESAKVGAATLYDNVRTFVDADKATIWTKAVANARVQLVVKVPTKPRWSVGGKDGLQFDVLAYRVVDPCTGMIVIAEPASQTGEVDRKACAGGSAEGVPALTPAMVQDTMKPVAEAALRCHERFRVAGKAKLEISIASDGSVAKYEQVGDFLGTPTGQCIDAAMRGIQFPRSQKPITRIGYPIVLP